jgi:hypothetical protein
MTKTILGIDPGASGGLAWAVNGKLATCAMPETVHDLVETIRSLLVDGDVEVHLEEVGGYISGAGMPGSSAFNFGRGFGEIIGVVAALELPLKLVRPQKWQKALGLGNSVGMTKTQWKNKLKARAQQLYPSEKITLSTADAVLIFHAASEGLLK